MKKSIQILAILLFVISLFNVAIAKSFDGLEFEIPFSFVVAGKAFEAGTYSLKRLNNSNPNLLVLRKDNEKRVTILLTQGVSGEKPNLRSVLMFKHSEGRYFMDAIWLANELQGYQFLSNEPKSKSPKGDKTEIVQVNNK